MTSLIESARVPWSHQGAHPNNETVRNSGKKKKQKPCCHWSIPAPYTVYLQFFHVPLGHLQFSVSCWGSSTYTPSSFPQKVLYSKGPYDALQTGWSLQVGVSQLSGSYPESLHQSINRSQSCNTCIHGMTLPFETAFVSEGACCHPGVVLTSSSSTPFGVWMLCKSGLLAMSSNSKTRLRVKSCVTKACYRRKKTTGSN